MQKLSKLQKKCKKVQKVEIKLISLAFYFQKCCANGRDETENTQFIKALASKATYIDANFGQIAKTLRYPADYVSKCCSLNIRKPHFGEGNWAGAL